MTVFPRCEVGGLSLSRMIVGSNWFLGWSHTGESQDALIHERIGDYRAVADILEVFFKAGVDTVMAPMANPVSTRLIDGIHEAEQRTGVRAIIVDTPIINIQDSEEARSEAYRLFDISADIGCAICMPHHSSVEQLVDRQSRRIMRLGDYTKAIRERGLVPGLSAHMPEVVWFADEGNEDVETYIQIYNCMGFLMQLEVEFINQLIHRAKKPVMTIKPMAAGRVTPFIGLNFVWNTIRDCDMVTVGTMTPREAMEVIEFSWAALERRRPDIAGRATPSKGTILNR